MANSIDRIHWNKKLEVVRLYFEDESRTIVPKLVKKFGEKNFKVEKGVVYLNGREIVVDTKRKQKIISVEEDKFGGQVKAYDRIKRKYINISRRDVAKVFQGSERRQLKARYQPQKGNTYYAGQPGHIEIDLTFYRNQKIPVFGAIDLYSRYCFYKRVKDKKASSVVVVLKEFVKKFESKSNFRINLVSTDSGVEFQKEFTEFLETYKPKEIRYDRKTKSRKLIENLNGHLRRYVERIGWDTIADLDKLIESFVETYNDSKHSVTKQTPNDLISIDKDKVSTFALRKQAGGPGFAKAALSVGDKVRIYDPRRKEVKAEQKKKLKGKIKLNEDDYVKQYTSFHRGIAPHWTKTVYTIKEVRKAKKRSTRYVLKERQGQFFRHELQKAYEITKVDPRKKVLEDRKQKAKKLEELLPSPVRAAKYVRKEYILKYSDEKEIREKDPAVIIDVYKNFLITFHKSALFTFANEKELHRATGKVYSKKEVKSYIDLNPDHMERVKKEIEETIVEIRESI